MGSEMCIRDRTTCETWRDVLESGLKRKFRVHYGEAPFQVPESLEDTNYWVKPIAGKEDVRRKKLRTQILTSVMMALSYVVMYNPRIIVGIGQGGLISSLMTFPLLNEAACRYRVVTSTEMSDIRRAWAGVSSIISINPVMLPQRSNHEEIVAAVPEIKFTQPKGIFSVILQDGTNRLKSKFGAALVGKGGFPAIAAGDFELEAAAKVTACLSARTPIFIDICNSFNTRLWRRRRFSACGKYTSKFLFQSTSCNQFWADTQRGEIIFCG